MRFEDHGILEKDLYEEDLCQHLCIEYKNEFDKWWDPDRFDWRYSYVLAEYCPEHFHKWWDPNRVNLPPQVYTRYLARRHLDKWQKWLDEKCMDAISKDRSFPLDLLLALVRKVPDTIKFKLLLKIREGNPNRLHNIMKYLPKSITEKTKIMCTLE